MKKILLSSMAAALVATTALTASTLTLGSVSWDDSNTTTGEKAKTFDAALTLNAHYDVNLDNNGTGSTSVIYTPSVDLAKDSKITFSVKNGFLENSNDWKLTNLDTNHSVASILDYTEGDNADKDYTDIIFKLSEAIDAGSTIVLFEDNDGKDDNKTDASKFVLPKGTSDDATISISRVTDTDGADIKAGVVSGIPLLTKSDSTLVADYNGSTNTIDVNVGRVKFTDGNAIAESTLKVSTGTADYKYTLGANTSYTVTVKGDMTAVKTVKLNGTAMTIDADKGEATITSDNATLGLGDAAKSLNIEVDGETILKTRSFTVDVVINDIDGKNPNATTDKHDFGTNPNKMVWDINGYEVTVRNFANNPGVKTSVITLFNDSTLDAELSADITMTDGTKLDTIVFPEKVAAGTRAVVSAAQIDAMTGGALGKQDFTIKFTMTSPSADSHAMAFQETTKGSRILVNN